MIFCEVEEHNRSPLIDQSQQRDFEYSLCCRGVQPVNLKLTYYDPGIDFERCTGMWKKNQYASGQINVQ